MSKTLTDNSTYKNIELGAGCGNFGQVFHSKCYLTEKNDLKDRCKDNSIDWFCSAEELPWRDNRFESVIMCNPYGYGFRDAEDSLVLLKEIVRVLKTDGRIIIVGTMSNMYCPGYRIQKAVTSFMEANENIKLTFQEEDIVSSAAYAGYTFRRLDSTETHPTKRYTITVIK